MKLRNIIALSALGISLASGATLQLTDGPGQATILQDSLGQPLAGAAWGIVVDTGGDGFGDYSNELLNFSIQNGFVGDTDDFFYLSANTTSSIGLILGAAMQIIANYDVEEAVGPSQSYKILWFEDKAAGDVVDGGTNFGLTEATATLPTSNAHNPAVDVFYGDNGPANLTVVPEPSALLLGAVGLLGLLRRRR